MNMQEFQSFYQKKVGAVYRYVYSKVGSREEAEDLTSEIFLKAAHSLDQERSPKSMHCWLFLVAHTTVADYWRAHYRQPTSSLDELLETGWEGPTEEGPTATSSMPAYQLQRLLQALPKHYREVLTCRFLLDLSVKDTALKMGVTVANAKVLQLRALKRAAALEPLVTDKQYEVLQEF